MKTTTEKYYKLSQIVLYGASKMLPSIFLQLYLQNFAVDFLRVRKGVQEINSGKSMSAG